MLSFRNVIQILIAYLKFIITLQYVPIVPNILLYKWTNVRKVLISFLLTLESAMDEFQGPRHGASDITGFAVYWPAYAGIKLTCLVTEAWCMQAACLWSLHGIKPATAILLTKYVTDRPPPCGTHYQCSYLIIARHKRQWEVSSSYGVSSRLLLRSAPDPCTAKMNSFQARIECRKEPWGAIECQWKPIPHREPPRMHGSL